MLGITFRISAAGAMNRFYFVNFTEVVISLRCNQSKDHFKYLREFTWLLKLHHLTHVVIYYVKRNGIYYYLLFYFTFRQRQQYISEHLPWAIQTGLNSKQLLNVYFEKRWEQPVADLQAELNITPLRTG